MRRLAASKEILVCVGPGGVGKTTAAAALGVLAAREGQRTLVCTIDPAPRLADALGVPHLGPDPCPIADQTSRALGIDPPGSLHAARVDTARAFDDLICEQETDPQRRERILSNSLYRHLTADLTGAPEYAATLSLYRLRQSRAYDLVVLDTPPTANALDFLETPHRLTDAINSPVVHWLARRSGPAGRLSIGGLAGGGAAVLRRLGKLVGSQFLDDLGAFLVDVRGAMGTFGQRASDIESMLRAPTVGFVLILSPEASAVNEALYFASRLRAAGTPLAGFIANRVLSSPALADSGALRAHLMERGRLAGLAPEAIERAIAQAGDVASYLTHVAQDQQNEMARLAAEAPGKPIIRVPLLAHDVSNLESLRAVTECLENAG